MKPEFCLPRLIFWELTKGCNLRCLHCRASSPEVLESYDMREEEVYSVMDNILDQGRPILVLTGGEPLSRPDLKGIVQGAVGRGFRVAVATNGTLLDRDTAVWLKGEGVEKVSISLDGRGEVHDRIRGVPGSFDGALEGLRAAVGSSLPVQINMTILRENMDRMEEMVNLAAEEGAAGIHIFMLVPVGCGLDIPEEEILSPADYERLLHRFLELSLEHHDLDIRATCAPHFYRIVRQEKGLLHGMPEPMRRMLMGRGCLAGTGVLFISHRGDVQPCGYLPVVLGNLVRESLGDILKSSPYLKVIRNHDNLKGKCHICEFRAVCFGCRARAYYRTGDFMDEEPFCLYEPGEGVRRISF